MARLTSIEAYRSIQSTDWINQQYKDIYAFMYDHGPLSSGEVYVGMGKQGAVQGVNQTRARITEMRDMDMLIEVGKKRCSVTERMVISWDVSGKPAVKKKKRLTNEDKIRRLKKAYRLLIKYAPQDIKIKARAILEGKND
jgi:hypothetical protein